MNTILDDACASIRGAAKRACEQAAGVDACRWYLQRMDGSLLAAETCQDDDMRAAHYLDAIGNLEVTSFAACRHAAGDNDYYARGPIPPKPWHNDVIRVDPTTITNLVRIRATWLGRLHPAARGECDEGSYLRAESYIVGCAALELYEWLADAWSNLRALEVPGMDTPLWACDALNTLRVVELERAGIGTLRDELANAVEDSYSADTGKAAGAGAIWITAPRTPEEICKSIRSCREKLAGRAPWALYARRPAGWRE